MALMKQWDGAAWVEVAAQEGVPSIQDTPVDGATTAGISSNWAYDHVNNPVAHLVPARIVAVTTTASPTSSDSGTVYTNEGDANGATITLPTAAAGLQFSAVVQTTQTLTITANTDDTIRIGSSVTAAAGSISSAVVGSSITLQAINATEWVALSTVGSWSI